jgi:DNA-binding IclR family transcriptional regulator
VTLACSYCTANDKSLRYHARQAEREQRANGAPKAATIAQIKHFKAEIAECRATGHFRDADRQERAAASSNHTRFGR